MWLAHPVMPALDFADILYPSIEPFIAEYAIYSPFVVKALLECSSFSHKDKVFTVLRAQQDRLQQAVSEETAEQRAMREAMVVGGDGNSVKKGQKSGRAQDIGNKGCALLLEML